MQKIIEYIGKFDYLRSRIKVNFKEKSISIDQYDKNGRHYSAGHYGEDLTAVKNAGMKGEKAVCQALSIYLKDHFSINAKIYELQTYSFDTVEKKYYFTKEKNI